jgi:hypothetical protein
VVEVGKEVHTLTDLYVLGEGQHLKVTLQAHPTSFEKLAGEYRESRTEMRRLEARPVPASSSKDE